MSLITTCITIAVLLKGYAGSEIANHEFFTRDVAMRFDSLLQSIKNEVSPTTSLAADGDLSAIMDRGEQFDWAKLLFAQNDTFLVAASRSDISISTVVLGLDEVFIDSIQKYKRTPILSTADFLEAISLNGEVIIFEGSSDNGLIFVWRRQVWAGAAETIPPVVISQAALAGRPVELRPIAHDGHVFLAVISRKSRKDKTSNFRLYLVEERATIVAERDVQCDTQMFLSARSTSDVLDLAISCQKRVIYFRFANASLTAPAEITLSDDILGLTPMTDCLVRRPFLLATHDTRSVALWLNHRGNLVIWKNISLPAVDAFCVGDETVFTYSQAGMIYLQDNHEKTLNLSVKSCPRISSVTPVIQRNQVTLAIFCENTPDSVRFTRVRYVQDTPPLAMQRDEAVRGAAGRLDDAEVTLKRNRATLRRFESVLDDRLVVTDRDDQNISVPILFNDVSVSGSVKAEKLSVEASGRLLSRFPALKNLQSKARALGTKMKDLEGRIPTLMTFNANQHIFASVQVPKMSANYCNILSINLNTLNGIPYEHYKTKFLLMEEEQTVSTNLRLNRLITKNIKVRQFIDGETIHSPSDFLDTSRADERIRGYHSFASIEVTGDIHRLSHTPLTINGIRLSDVVDQGSNVDFRKRRFNGTVKAVNRLNVININNINYDQWRNVVRLTKDSQRKIRGSSLTVYGNVIVRGSAKLPSINGVNVFKLYQGAVKLNEEQQKIYSPVAFENQLHIDKLELTKVNDVPWKDILRKDSEYIVADLYFDEGVVTGDLLSRSINGLDFNKDVLVSGLDQRITGKLTLTSNVAVIGESGVTMEDGATVNGVDPSYFSLYNQYNTISVVKEIVNLDRHMTVKGDMKASLLNGHEFPDFTTDFWMKDFDQKIPAHVNIESAEFQKGVRISSLNKHTLDEYWLKNKKHVVRGKNKFSNVAARKSLNLGEGNGIAGVDLTKLKESVMNVYSEQTIVGNKTMNEVTVKDLIVKNGLLRGMNIEDDLSHFRTFPGFMRFHGDVSARRIRFGGNLKATIINDEFSRSLLARQPNVVNRIIGHVFFAEVQVDDLSVDGKLNNIVIDQWYNKTVSTNSKQLIFSYPLTIDGDVNFHSYAEVLKMNSKIVDNFISEMVEACDGCRVTGSKIFNPPVTIQNNLEAQYVNEINLNDLSRRLLSKSNPQRVEAVYKFSRITGVSVKTNTISGLPVDEMVLLGPSMIFNQPVTVAADVIFQKKVTSSQGWISDCKVDELLKPPIIEHLSTQNYYFQRLKVFGDIQVQGRIRFGKDKVDLVHFLNKVLRKSVNETISGSVNFERLVFLNSLHAQTINSVPVEQFMAKLLKPQSHRHLHFNVRLDTVHVRELRALAIESSRVNGLNLTEIYNGGVRRGHSDPIFGVKIFNRDSRIQNNLVVNYINGIHFDEFSRINGEPIAHKVIFTRPISVSGDLYVSGRINDHLPSDLLQPFTFLQTYEDSWFLPMAYDSVTVDGDLIVETINEIRLDDIIVKSSSTPQIVTGTKHIHGGLIVRGLTNADFVNNIDINQFGQDRVYYGPEKQLTRYERDVAASDQVRTIDRLRRAAYKLSRMNKRNYVFANDISELLRISKEDEIPLRRVTDVKIYNVGGIQKLYTVIEYDCLSWSVCPCLETYAFKVKGDKFGEEEYAKGRNIPVVLHEPYNFFYNLNFWCYSSDYQATLSQIPFENLSRNVVAIDMPSVGIVLEFVAMPGRNKFYFVALSRTPGKQEYQINVFSSNFTIIWKEVFASKVNINLKKNCSDWMLLVTNAAATSGGSAFYTWKQDDELFVKTMNLPAASQGDIFNQDGLSFLFLIVSSYQHSASQPGFSSVVIYKSEGCGLYEQFAVLDDGHFSSLASFSIDNGVYLAGASYEKNIITVFKFVRFEGFHEIESILIPRPTSVKHIRRRRNHYLAAASDYKSLVLLKLNFKGLFYSNLVREHVKEFYVK